MSVKFSKSSGLSNVVLYYTFLLTGELYATVRLYQTYTLRGNKPVQLFVARKGRWEMSRVTRYTKFSRSLKRVQHILKYCCFDNNLPWITSESMFTVMMDDKDRSEVSVEDFQRWKVPQLRNIFSRSGPWKVKTHQGRTSSACLCCIPTADAYIVQYKVNMKRWNRERQNAESY